MKTINAFELMDKIYNQKASFKLINALGPIQFAKARIPTSVNSNTKEEILQKMSRKDEIVIYSTNSICYKSRVLYYQLESLGYRKIWHFSGGLEEWCNLGLPLAGTMSARLSYAA
jgi:hypothetical protein